MNRSQRSAIFSGYLSQRDLYYENAEHYNKLRLYRKSSEMLWGAITQTIKALASIFGIRIFAHNQFRNYMEDISRAENERYYITEFLKLERLHKNFYDEELSPSDFHLLFEDALVYMTKIDDLMMKHSSP